MTSEPNCIFIYNHFFDNFWVINWIRSDHCPALCFVYSFLSQKEATKAAYFFICIGPAAATNSADHEIRDFIQIRERRERNPQPFDTHTHKQTESRTKRHSPALLLSRDTKTSRRKNVKNVGQFSLLSFWLTFDASCFSLPRKTTALVFYFCPDTGSGKCADCSDRF